MSMRIWNRPSRRRKKRRNEGRGIARRLPVRFLAVLTISLISVASCGIPTVTFIAEPIFRTPTGSTLRFDHNTANDTEDFKGYEIYYKVYNAVDPSSQIDSDRSYIEGAETPGTSRLVLRDFLRMVRTDSGTATGSGLLDPPMIPVGSGQRDNAFTVSIVFASGEDTVVVDNPGEAAGSLRLYRQNVLLDEQNPATVFEGFNQGGEYNYVPGGSGNDADLARMLDSEYDQTETTRVAVAVIAFGIDATNFQRIYSTPIYLGFVTL